MVLYNNKAELFAAGVETNITSGSHAAQDCTICLKPLLVSSSTATPNGSPNGANNTSASRLPNSNDAAGYHAAVQILACGHLHGLECLSAWLDVGYTCPTCNRALLHVQNYQNNHYLPPAYQFLDSPSSGNGTLVDDGEDFMLSEDEENWETDNDDEVMEDEEDAESSGSEQGGMELNNDGDLESE
jgi:hypothetical protein